MPTGGTQWMRQVRESGLTRRDVLRGGAVAAGVLAAGAIAPSTAVAATRRSPHDARVVVIGAGLAGLTCAYRLARRGVQVQLFEARQDRVGGRCWSARDFAGGQVAEHGGEFVDTRHVHLLRLARSLGLKLDDSEKLRPKGVKGIVAIKGEVRTSAELGKNLPRVLRRLAADARRIGPYRYDRAGRAARAFDELSVADWLHANVPGGRSSLLATRIADGAAGFWGGDPEDLSAINLIEQYLAPYEGADERWIIHGGNDQVPNLLAERLPEGTVQLATPLEAVRRAGRGYELRFTGLADPVTADFVVFALPFTTLRDVDLSHAGLSARKRAAIEHHGMGTNAKVLLQFDRKFAKFHRWSGSLSTDDPRWGSWDSTVGDGGAESLLTIFSGGSAGAGYPAERSHGPAPEAVVKASLDWLDRHVPGIAGAYNGHSWLDSWADDPWVHGSYATFAPGQYTRYWGYSKLPEGRLHFAGEHTSTHSQGYLNGGVESGERAAKEILAALG
ncbi:flavin monoamine oxidase family protein [Nonomuraea sp. NPDC050556]|uniref:flavin monoamine oxidase family protein n=1 Tax=Nonomuraea sp. NPDC050556 TaxID=3364369 RepID=UPI0037A4EE89